MLKKVLIFAILSAVLFSSFSFATDAFEFNKSEFSADGFYLYDLNHNLLMASENINKTISPSSTAKIMSACVVLESNIDFDQKITISENMLKNVSGRSMLLEAGNILTVRDLVYAMICGGYNDATHILALIVSPTLNEFTQRMNNKASELGMNNTNYSNPTGIDQNGMYTTIQDIAKLSKYMANNPIFVEICSTKSYKLSDEAVCKYSTITNRSSLISEYNGLSSFNVGSSNSGDCTVLFYKTSELSLISIVMNVKPQNESNKNYAEKCSKELISYALSNYSSKTLKTKNEIITSLPVKFAISSKNIDIYLQNDLSVFLSNDININSDLTYSIYIENGELTAPLQSGEVIGTLIVFQDGIMLASVPLIIKESVSRNKFLYLMDIIKQYILSKQFLLICLIFLITLIYYNKSRKRKFKKRKRKTRKSQLR